MTPQTKHINTINAEINHFMESILIREDESAVDLLTFIESLFIDRSDNDLISKIYNKFMKLKRVASNADFLYIRNFSPLEQSK